MCMHLAWYKILGADKVFFLYWNMNKQITNEIRLRYQNCYVVYKVDLLLGRNHDDLFQLVNYD